MIEKIISIQLNDTAKEFLLNDYFTEAALINSKFITNAAKRGEFTELILNQLNTLLRRNTPPDVCLLHYVLFALLRFETFL